MNLPVPPDVKLVPEAGIWHRLWSIRFWFLSILLGSIAAYFTDHPDKQAMFPAWVDAAEVLRWMSGAAGVFGMMSRMVVQPGLGKS